MEFRILGPIEVSSGGQPLQLGGARQRALLAYLLLHANRVVSTDRLLDELWAEPPAGGVTVLQTQVSRLRKPLGDRIASSGRGYQLHVEPGELDLGRFRELLAEAGATVDPRERSRLLREADGLWRGEALAGLDVPFAAAEAAALEELRLGALEDRLAADLDRGLGTELVSELSALVARYPLRERLRGQLILALYRAGRQAEALEAYRQTRQTLDEELGLEPSPSLRELERAILRHDPALTPLTAATLESAPVERAPHRRMRPLVLAAAALLAVGAAGAATAVVLTDADGAKQALRTLKTHGTVATPPTHLHRASTHATRAHARSHAKRIRATHHAAPLALTPVVSAVTTITEPAASTAKNPATTTTATQAKTTTTRATATPPPTPVTISDSFDGDQIDGTIWYQIQAGSGWGFAQNNGQLEFTFPPGTTPGGQYDAAGGHIGTQCSFPGDFDARVDFTLTAWPPQNGVVASLWGWFGPTNIAAQVNRSSNQWGDSYNAWFDSTPPATVFVPDKSGTLRLARVHGVLTGYFLHNGRWQSMSTRRIDLPVKIAVGASTGAGTGTSSGGNRSSSTSTTSASPASTRAARPEASHRPIQTAGSVDPGRIRRNAVAAFWSVRADRDELEAVVSGFDRTDRLWADSNDVPLVDLVDLVVEPDPAGAVDDDVRLFLFAVAVGHGCADAGRVAEVGDAEVLGVDVLAREAGLDAGCALAGGVLDVLQVRDREGRHGDGSPDLGVGGTAYVARGSIAA